MSDTVPSSVPALDYVTGNGLNEHGAFTQSSHAADDGYVPPAGSFVNEAGDVHVLVSADGTRYRVLGGGTWREYSAVDGENAR